MHKIRMWRGTLCCPSFVDGKRLLCTGGICGYSLGSLSKDGGIIRSCGLQPFSIRRMEWLIRSKVCTLCTKNGWRATNRECSVLLSKYAVVRDSSMASEGRCSSTKDSSIASMCASAPCVPTSVADLQPPTPHPPGGSWLSRRWTSSFFDPVLF